MYFAVLVFLFIHFPSDYITAENATIEVLGPIVENIKGVLGDALVEIQGLVGQSVDVVLGVEGGALLVVGDVAAAIFGLLSVCISFLLYDDII